MQAFEISTCFKPSIDWAFSNIVCFAELFLKIFQINRSSVSTTCKSGYSLIKCTKHRASLWLRQLMYKAYGDTCCIFLCIQFCLPLIAFVPSKPEKRIKLSLIYFSENISSSSVVIAAAVFYSSSFLTQINFSDAAWVVLLMNLAKTGNWARPALSVLSTDNDDHW